MIRHTAGFLRRLVEQYAGTAELRRSNEELSRRLVQLETQANGLVRSVMAGKEIDLVDFGELRVFMFTDDLSYVQVGEKYKHQPPPQTVRDLSRPLRTPPERYSNDAEPILSTLLSHHWVNEIDFCVLDVGCQYGTSAMAAAQIILASAQENHVYAFDPGVAGQLAASNIKLNGLQERVTFERVGISDSSLPRLVFSELGHSENNRIVNRMPSTEILSYVVPCISIDDYVVEHRIREHIIAKIDTQGGEVEVFEGMMKTRRDRHVTCITEFVPSAIATRARPVEWLTRVTEECAVFEINQPDLFLAKSHKLRPIPKNTLAAFVAEVDSRALATTDVLIVPERLPGFDHLVTRLS